MNTSYFSKIKSLKLTPKNLVSIAAKKPDGFNCREYKKLAPTWDIFKKYKNDGNKEEYMVKYADQILSKLNPKEVYEELGENAVLLCWESSEKFCHRHLVAGWLEKKFKYKN